mmetsp:Transcript_27598/g.85808  ORF Transcript_27598/g.85808 Transcript_27598/m.85808 type:complete len:382 (-) Transcript_27598:33-1178(-)
MDTDVDTLFSYYTRQEVNVRDWRLGCTRYTCELLLFAYIVVGVFIYGQGYLTFEQARGSIATHVRGDAVAVSIGKPGTRYFSAEDITYPGLENGNVFVATRQRVMRQKRGVCEDYNMPCSSESDCTVSVGGRCSGLGFCKEPSWCPVDEVPEIYELEVGDLFIWVKSAIQFVKLAADKVFSTEHGHAYPERGVNLFSVRDLLLMCTPVPVRYEEISKLGAAIEVQFIWNCNLDHATCKPDVKARRLDVLFDPHNIGYAFNYSERISENERALIEMQGVRIFLRTYGTAHKTSIPNLVMKASTTCTLLGLAPIITNLFMISVGRRHKRYFARKYEESPNFKEYLESLHRSREHHAEERDGPQETSAAQQREQEWQRRLDEDD